MLLLMLFIHFTCSNHTISSHCKVIVEILLICCIKQKMLLQKAIFLFSDNFIINKILNLFTFQLF